MNVCFTKALPELKLSLPLPLQICHRVPVYLDFTIGNILRRNKPPLLPFLIPLHLFVNVNLPILKIDIIPKKSKGFSNSRSCPVTKEQWYITGMPLWKTRENLIHNFSRQRYLV